MIKGNSLIYIYAFDKPSEAGMIALKAN